MVDRRAILVIDDDLGTREIFNWTLKAYGFRVTTAGSGARAIALGKSGQFNLMLLDLRLPDMSGIDVVRSLQRDGAVVPFVLVSAFITDPVAAEAKDLGAVGVWAKPLSGETIADNVQKALSGFA